MVLGLCGQRELAPALPSRYAMAKAQEMVYLAFLVTLVEGERASPPLRQWLDPDVNRCMTFTG